MNPTRLPDHPAFLRLEPAEKDILMNASETWEAPAGSTLYHPGDSGEDLLMVLSGRLEYGDRNPGDRRWMAGELWGEDRLENPEPLERPIVAAEDSTWLRWSRTALSALLAGYPRLSVNLAPVGNDAGDTVSGLASLPRSARTAGVPHTRRSSLRPAAAGLFLALAGVVAVSLAGISLDFLPPSAPLAAPALFGGWFLVFLFVRLFTEYSIDPDAVASRTFDWSRFAVESRNVPLDRIQGVEIERHGILRRILGYGSVILKTSALEGELVIRDITAPDLLAAEISRLREAGSRREESRVRETLRKSLEGSGLAAGVPRLLRTAGHIPDAGSSGEIRFRKSLAVLASRMILPVLLMVLPLVFADDIAGLLTGTLDLSAGIIRMAALLPFFWAWYRFEDWRNDSFQVSGGYAVDLYRKPLGLKENRSQVDLVSVQNIRTEQKGPFPVLFRYGDVVLVTAGGASDTVFRNVSRPWRVQQALFRAREEGLRRLEEGRMEERREDFLRFAEALDQIRNN